MVRRFLAGAVVGVVATVGMDQVLARLPAGTSPHPIAGFCTVRPPAAAIRMDWWSAFLGRYHPAVDRRARQHERNRQWLGPQCEGLRRPRPAGNDGFPPAPSAPTPWVPNPSQTVYPIRPVSNPAAHVIVVWFRDYLRLADNPTLADVLAAADWVVPVYVADPGLRGETR